MSDQDSTPPDGFRVIPGYQRYAINECGTILSICVKGIRSGKDKPWSDASRKSVTADKDGYHIVHLRHDGHSRHIRVHKLVLLTFVGSCPDGMECRHLDGCRTNNHVDNLAWGTSSENKRDQIKHGTDIRGERHGRSKLTAADVFEIRRRAADGERYADIAKDFSVIFDSVSSIVNRRTWKHI